MRCFVTGGAGFIGSHFVDALLARGDELVVFDNLSTGYEENLAHHAPNERLLLVRGDLRDRDAVLEAMDGCDFVFHFAAYMNNLFRGDAHDTRIEIDHNIIGTYHVLEAMRKLRVPRICYSSSATIYGDAQVFPTPESYMPIQTSLYGASKFTGELYTEVFSNYFDIQSYIFRFVSWIGERYSHGVILDFVIKKLLRNPRELEILGDGTQRKSFLYVSDGVAGVFRALEGFGDRVNVFNLGHTGYITVREIADIVCDEMGLENVRYRFTGGKVGWKGDAPFVHLDVTRVRGLGWEPKVGIEEGVRRTVRFLLENRDFFAKSDKVW